MIAWIAILLAYYVPTFVVHEAGHALAACALRLPWRLTFRWWGPGVVVGRDGVLLSRRQVVLSCAAGPLANIVLCVVAYLLGWGLLVLVGLDVLLFNLLPLPHSDGLRMLLPGRAIRKALEAEKSRAVARV